MMWPGQNAQVSKHKKAIVKLAVFSHKICWPSLASPSKYCTDGGFPLQMRAISELFESTTLVVPCNESGAGDGLSPLSGMNLSVRPLTVPKGEGLRRKIDMLLWVLSNGPVLLQEAWRADAIHAPIPGDIGTFGMLLALLLRKPLLVRHCGNWTVQTTTAERFWKWSMERFAGGRNVMLATGGAAESPSQKNPEVKWIFSTSMNEAQMQDKTAKELPVSGEIRLIIACRQEKKKGTDIVIESLPLLLSDLPHISLDIVGGGSLTQSLKQKAESLGVSDRVRFHGKVSQAKVVELLRTAHLFCYPTQASEGFPKVVLEALASGLPVITTRVSVLPQLIQHCGVLIDEASPEALAKAVREICHEPEAYRQMSADALETARNYTLEGWRDAIGKALSDAWGSEYASTERSRELEGRPAL